MSVYLFDCLSNCLPVHVCVHVHVLRPCMYLEIYIGPFKNLSEMLTLLNLFILCSHPKEMKTCLPTKRIIASSMGLIPRIVNGGVPTRLRLPPGLQPELTADQMEPW